VEGVVAQRPRELNHQSQWPRMNFVSRNQGHTVITQIPLMLLGATAIFALPFLAFSLIHILRGTDAEGKWFSLVFGLLIGWLLLEFVATRETIEIDPTTRTLTHVIHGIFRRRRQSIDLSRMTEVRIEMRKDMRGRSYDYLYIAGNGQRCLLNTPGKTLNHRAAAKLLGEVTGLPFEIAKGEPITRQSP
jgi:hypothetical protein